MFCSNSSATFMKDHLESYFLLTYLERSLQAEEPVPLPNLECPGGHSGHRDLNPMYRPFCLLFWRLFVAAGEIDI